MYLFCLIKYYFYFQELENAPSCDAVIRERISKLPPEIADVSLLSQLKGQYFVHVRFQKMCVVVKICIYIVICFVVCNWNFLYLLTLNEIRRLICF